ncbi:MULTISPECIES: hypothetical protein [unclassified Burkholderia]|uniref:hypothetical protein n=1 Tax=unclassified Burkholderia TaxID=2613784 RepID=UPI000752C0B6|nr:MULTISPECIES: hypothetical protein [unclassified Burkholderia]AOI78642.1 hypothetical protein WS54_20360 [Burkholderia sp. NRF60-BP8]KVA05594.1 hypothetical protein WS54_30850 [Burkholderia sp. NRF60-BP8]KWE57583.1 hypothetical protein WT53_16890 [Burkholderia sp. MSMB2157WGS]
MGLYAALVSLKAAAFQPARVPHPAALSGGARVNADAREPEVVMPVRRRFAGTGPYAPRRAIGRKKCPPCVSKCDRIGKFVTYRESNNKKKNT